MPDQFLTVRDAMIELNVSEKFVRRAIKSGELTATRDIKRRYLIKRSDFEAFIATRKGFPQGHGVYAPRTLSQPNLGEQKTDH